ncbi:hypothetical protein HL670_03918 [Serratia plymuthica]|uniref:hypothetical protein n=1 Tax=Serratia plymuthica TaxID=82996 RepID=UPI00148D56CC|nr:hypothetical protein [Serratia plymuthica]QJW57021.1 hypothetical protein HL670_03918 [Serratia plymuthica]
MANSFDFELKANDEASAAILRIEEVVKNLNPLLDKTRDALALGGRIRETILTIWGVASTFWQRTPAAVYSLSVIWSRH